MKSFSLLVAERRAPWRSLRLVASGVTTLDELAGLLVRELGLEPGRAASFFRSAKAWDERTEFSSHGRSEHALQGVRLDRFALRPGSTFLYLHDLDRPRRHELRVESVAEVGESPRGESPRGETLRVVERVTPAARSDVTLASRLHDVLALDEEELSEEAQRAHLVDSLRTADELLALGQEEIERISVDEGLDVQEWLADLPGELARAELADEALALAARAARLLDLPALLADRAVILGNLGRRPEAEAQVAEVLAHPDSGAAQVATCGDVYREFGELARAEELYQRALPLADDRDDIELVRERMVSLLVAQGRAGEARAFELALEGLHADDLRAHPAEPGADDELFPLPRVGRNDPCPCGSGKKFKKCCAREAGEAERGELEFLTPGLLRALEHVLASASAAGVRAGMARFAGPDFEGLELREALPLLPEEGAELAYLDWWLVDREEAPGTTLLDRYLEKRAGKLDPREARVLRRLGTTALGLYRVELPQLDPGSEPRASRARLHDLLTGEARELTIEEAVALSTASHQLLRIVVVEGRPRAVHEGVPVRPAHAERIVAELGSRWASLSRAERAPALFQAWLDALHASAVPG